MIEKKFTAPKNDAWRASRAATWFVRDKRLYVYDDQWVERELAMLDDHVSSIEVNTSETLLLASGWRKTWLVDLRAASSRCIQPNALSFPFFYTNDIAVLARPTADPLGAELRTVDARTDTALSTLQIREETAYMLPMRPATIAIMVRTRRDRDFTTCLTTTIDAAGEFGALSESSEILLASHDGRTVQIDRETGGCRLSWDGGSLLVDRIAMFGSRSGGGPEHVFFGEGWIGVISTEHIVAFLDSTTGEVLEQAAFDRNSGGVLPNIPRRFPESPTCAYVVPLERGRFVVRTKESDTVYEFFRP